MTDDRLTDAQIANIEELAQRGIEDTIARAAIMHLAAELRRAREALRIIAGYEQCADNLMSKVAVARAALEEPTDGNTER